MEQIQLQKKDVEIVESITQKKEFKKLGTYLKRIDGGTIFRYCRKNNTMEKAKYEKVQVYDISKKSKSKLIVQKESTYVEALNINNAVKRLLKGKIIFST